jgi:predicted DNA-binding protein (MmcQ/YjbR family)
MDIESTRAYCLSFPHSTEKVQWGNDLVFKIAGKMFAVVVLEGASKYCLSFKCTEETFAELVEQDGIDPAPYSARYHWVALERFDVMGEKELKALLRNSYDLVFEKLPKKIKSELEGQTEKPSRASRKRR